MPIQSNAGVNPTQRYNDPQEFYSPVSNAFANAYQVVSVALTGANGNFSGTAISIATNTPLDNGTVSNINLLTNLDVRLHRVANIAALRAFVVTSGFTSAVGSLMPAAIDVAGYYSPNDYGGGIFDYSASSTATDDGFSVIAPTTGTGRWIRRFEPWGVCPEMAGAVGNYSYALWQVGTGAMGSTNVVSKDTNAFTTIFAYAATINGIRIMLGAGKRYYIDTYNPTFVPPNVSIEGTLATFNNGASYTQSSLQQSQLVFGNSAGFKFSDGCALRRLVCWQAGLVENPTSLSQVRSIVNGWTTAQSGFGNATMPTTNTVPQGVKGGAPCVIPVASTAGLYEGWGVTAANGAIPAGAKIEQFYQATFTASISNTTMIVSNVASGSLAVGMAIPGALTGTYITNQPGYTFQSTGAGGAGTYTVSIAQTMATNTVTSNAVVISLGAMYGSIPTGTEITMFAVVNWLFWAGDGVMEEVQIIGGHTGVIYTANVLISKCVADVGGVGFEAWNNGANGYLDKCTAFGIWSTGVSGSDAYAGAATRPGIGFQSHAANGGSNTGQSYNDCVAEDYAFSMVLGGEGSGQFGTKVWNFGPETTLSNGQFTCAILLYGDVRITEFHGCYAGTNSQAIGIYCHTPTSYVTFYGGSFGISNAACTLPVMDIGPGARGACFGTELNAEGAAYPLNFDPNVGFWAAVWPQFSGGNVPGYYIPAGAQGRVLILQGDFGPFQESNQTTFILPNMPTTPPSQTGAIYRSTANSNAVLMIV